MFMSDEADDVDACPACLGAGGDGFGPCNNCEGRGIMPRKNEYIDPLELAARSIGRPPALPVSGPGEDHGITRGWVPFALMAFFLAGVTAFNVVASCTNRKTRHEIHEKIQKAAVVGIRA